MRVKTPIARSSIIGIGIDLDNTLYFVYFIISNLYCFRCFLEVHINIYGENYMCILRFVLAILIILPCFQSILAQELYKGKPIAQIDWHGSISDCVSGEIIVKLEPSFDKSVFQTELSTLGLTIAQGPGRRGYARLEVSEGADIRQLIEEATKTKSIVYAEPNFIYKTSVIPNDEYFPLQWSLLNTGVNPSGGTADADMDCDEAWNQSTGVSSILVGVLDTGIPLVDGELSHPDLNDPSRFLLGLNTQNPGEPPTDDNGHGTHVTGTIAAQSNNSIGVTGVNWNCQILAIKVFNYRGSGSVYDLYEGIIYAVDNGCHVLNYSGGGSQSETVESAVAYADSNDVLICAAAGNGYNGPVSWPAAFSLRYGNVISVSSSDFKDNSSCFSSIGPEVTVAAPGGGCGATEANIYSTMPNYLAYLNNSYNYPLDYAYLKGTSMACPHVAGLASLILGADPTLRPDSVKRIIENTSDDRGDSGFDDFFGHGRINAYNALLSIGPLNIGHAPLVNTKNYSTDYLIDCTIFSVGTLWEDSLYLKYNTGSIWTTVPLQSASEAREYYAYIPFQSPGTYIDYFLYARDLSQNIDSTPVYTFKVIDYQLILDPKSAYSEEISQGYSIYDMTVTNDGVLNDAYSLSISENVWDVDILDFAGISQISSSETLTPGATFDFKIKVTVPSSVYGEIDSVFVSTTSINSPAQTGSAKCVTLSLGVPIAVPMLDNFDSGLLTPLTWNYNHGADVSELGINEPSQPYALHFDGNPSGRDTLVTQIFILRWGRSLNLQYAYQKRGGGDSPDHGDDLILEYINESGEWTLLHQHLGKDSDMTDFEMVGIPLPKDAYHDRFKIRFRNIADEGSNDDWFIDNLELTYSPQAKVSAPTPLTVTLEVGQSESMPLIVENSGPGLLTYETDVIIAFKSFDTFTKLLEEGKVEPASREYTPEFLANEPKKGEADTRTGFDLKYNSGGPDSYGYYWMSSNVSGGPDFNWIDISATGTVVEGLADDNYAGPFPIGFDFQFYGEIYTEFYISSNGFIGFGPPDNYESLTKKPFPTMDIPNNIIALLWDDLNPSDLNNPGGRIVYETSGGQLIVQFIDIPEYQAGVGDVFTGEIILRNDGAIRLQYLSIANGFDKKNCAIGIENQDGLDGLEVAFIISYFIKNNFCVAIYPPDVSWVSVSPSSGQTVQGVRDSLSVSLNAENLQPGTYDALLTVHTNDPDNVDQTWNFDVSMTVELPFVVGDDIGDGDMTIGDEKNAWKTWVDSDSTDIMFNQMLYQYKSSGFNKASEIIKYSGSTLWTGVTDVDDYGDVLYVLKLQGLEIYDITDLTNPVLVKKIRLGLGKETDRLQVHNNYLFVGMLDRLYIFDIIDPYKPVQLSLTILSGHISEIIIRDDRAYLGMIRYNNEKNDYPALFIYDISNLSDPQVVGKYESSATMKDCRSFVLNGDFIYSINYWDDRIEIISIVDETFPQQVFMTERRYPRDIAGLGNYLFIPCYDTLWAYDASDPDTLIELHYIECDPTAKVVEVHNGLIYTAHSHNSNYGITVFSYDPATGFDSVGNYNSLYHSRAMEFRDDKLFLPEALAGFSILSLTDPAAPQHISSVESKISFLLGLDVESDKVYMTNYASFIGQPDYNGLVVVDIADKANPYLVSHTPVSGNPSSVFVDDTLAFISECQPTYIYSVADPANPVFLSQYPIEWHQTKANVARDTFLYVTGSTSSLEIASIADPVNPYRLGQADSGYVRLGKDIILDGNLAYTLSSILNPRASYLRLVDVSNPSDPYLVGELQLSDETMPYLAYGHLHKRGDFIYIGGGRRGLVVVDIRDPANMEIVGEYQYLSELTQVEPFTDVASKRNYLFATSEFSIQVFDILDPTAPRLVQYVPLSDLAGEMEIQGDYLYVAGSRAMYVFHINLPAAACGDANADGSINVGDAVHLINFIFKGGEPPDPIEAGDANDDGVVNVGDAVYLINFVFKGGPEPNCL